MGTPINFNIIKGGLFGPLSANSLTLRDTVTVVKILDEDNMISDSADALATQQSIKAYVDAGDNGDVKGPASSTDEALARFNGTTGKLIQNSSAILNDAGLLTTTSLSTGALTSSSIGNSGLLTTTSVNVGATTQINAILDEDNMISDRADALATQQSIKAYVDNTAANSASYVLQSSQIDVDTTAEETVAYFAWDDSAYSSYNNGTVIFFHEDVADRDLTVDIFDGTVIIGTITLTAPTANGIATFAITNPIVDKKLELRTKKSAAAGTDPQVFGVQLEFPG